MRSGGPVSPAREDMRSTQLTYDTTGSPVSDISAEVRAFCEGAGDGLVSIFVPHATAGLAVIETGAGSEDDLVETLTRVIPRDDRYRHRHGSHGHGADHVLPAIVAPSLVLPVLDGAPALGTWQHIVLVDLNVDNPRRHVRLSFVRG